MNVNRTPTVTVSRLPRPEHQGDWHDRPARWSVEGPRAELQKFPTRKEAELYARIRRRSTDQWSAINAYVDAAMNRNPFYLTVKVHPAVPLRPKRVAWMKGVASIRTTPIAAGEDNDCTVVALAHATGKGYDEAHSHLKARGRKHRRGFSLGASLRKTRVLLNRSVSPVWRRFDPANKRKGSDLERAHKYGRTSFPAMKLKTAVERYCRSGRFVVGITGHALAVVDGQVMESYPSLPGCHVQYIYRVEPLLLAAPANP